MNTFVKNFLNINYKQALLAAVISVFAISMISFTQANAARTVLVRDKRVVVKACTTKSNRVNIRAKNNRKSDVHMVYAYIPAGVVWAKSNIPAGKFRGGVAAKNVGNGTTVNFYVQLKKSSSPQFMGQARIQSNFLPRCSS